MISAILVLIIVGLAFLIRSPGTEEPLEDTMYLDQINIETRDPQPAGRNLTPGPQ